MINYHNVRDKAGKFTKKEAVVVTSPARKRTPRKPKTVLVVGGGTILSAFLMDASGSMSGKEHATVSGFNEILTSAKKDAQQYKTTNVDMIAFFGTSYKLYPGEVTELINTLRYGGCGSNISGKIGYRPEMGGTALWESTYNLITALEEKLKTLPIGTKVILTIFTDGEENQSSMEWRDGRKIKEIIKAKQELGWVINFMGAGSKEQILAVTDSVGIFASNSLNYTNNAAGTKSSMDTFSRSRSVYSASVAKGVDSNIGFFANE